MKPNQKAPNADKALQPNAHAPVEHLAQGADPETKDGISFFAEDEPGVLLLTEEETETEETDFFGSEDVRNELEEK